jgi:hypothetical protein
LSRTFTDRELVERIARCWKDRERLELELDACVDTAADALHELCERRHSYPVGAALAETFRLWLADAEAQRWQAQDLELRRKCELLLREWENEEGRS